MAGISCPFCHIDHIDVHYGVDLCGRRESNMVGSLTLHSATASFDASDASVTRCLIWSPQASPSRGGTIHTPTGVKGLYHYSV